MLEWLLEPVLIGILSSQSLAKAHALDYDCIRPLTNTSQGARTVTNSNLSSNYEAKESVQLGLAGEPKVIENIPDSSLPHSGTGWIKITSKFRDSHVMTVWVDYCSMDGKLVTSCPFDKVADHAGLLVIQLTNLKVKETKIIEVVPGLHDVGVFDANELNPWKSKTMKVNVRAGQIRTLVCGTPLDSWQWKKACLRALFDHSYSDAMNEKLIYLNTLDFDAIPENVVSPVHRTEWRSE